MLFLTETQSEHFNLYQRRSEAKGITPLDLATMKHLNRKSKRYRYKDTVLRQIAVRERRDVSCITCALSLLIIYSKHTDLQGFGYINTQHIFQIPYLIVDV